MKTIAVAMQKGGVGKTTTTFNLAAEFIRLGYRVLVIDIDPQCNLSRSCRVFPEKDDNLFTTYELLTRADVTPQHAILQTEFGLDLIPASKDLSYADTHLKATALKPFEKLAGKLEQVTEYDYVLIDCPPTLNVLTTNALVAANFILGVVDCEDYALQGLEDFYETFRNVKAELNHRLDLIGVLMNKFVPNLKEQKRVVSSLEYSLENVLLKTRITRRTMLTRISQEGPVQLIDPNSAAAAEYAQLAEELLERMMAYAA